MQVSSSVRQNHKANVNDQYSALCLVKLRSRLPRFWKHLDVPAAYLDIMEGHFDRHASRTWDLCIFSKLTHFCPLKYYLAQFIFTKIIKIVASRCQILRLKCLKLDFGWGSFSEAYSVKALAGGRGLNRCPFPKTQQQYFIRQCAK